MSEDPYADARRAMVEEQLVPRGIVDARVLGAMERLPRQVFLPESLGSQAYDDCALPSAEGQTISQPYMVAIMTELLEVAPGLRVLEIGTGTGYQTALLAELVGPEGRVFTIELVAALAEQAQRRLTGLGYENIAFRIGDGTLGWPEEAPFDRILVTAGAPQREPPPLLEQLGPTGLMVIPLGGASWQDLYVIRRAGAEIARRSVLSCRFVPLLGRHAWSAEAYGRDRAG